jgi:hypothetical protein
MTTETAITVTTPEASQDGAIVPFASLGAFESAQRMAKLLAASTLVPKDYQGNVPNALIAMELASRIGCSVFQVMQNLDIIHGKPSFRASFLIATVNTSGRFSPLRFRFTGEPGTKSWGCVAFARDRETGDICEGAEITIGLAKAEGWSTKAGSKWLTMPQQMLMYRSAAFWVRVYAPELSMGMHAAEEVLDTVGVTVPDAPQLQVPSGSAALLEESLFADSDGVVEDKPPTREPGQEG